MKPILALALSLALLAGCGGTPTATEPPPTQTPWIVVVTSTADLQAASAEKPSAVAQPPATARATSTRPPATTAPKPTGSPLAATASPLPASSRVPTESPPSGTMIYPPPALLEPTNNQPVSWGSTVLLKWSSVGELGEDEYYHVHLERRPTTPGQEWYGDYVFTKETQFRAEVPFLAPFHYSVEHGQANVYWWVRVVKKTDQDQAGKPTGVDISPYSEERTLVLDPKP